MTVKPVVERRGLTISSNLVHSLSGTPPTTVNFFGIWHVWFSRL